MFGRKAPRIEVSPELRRIFDDCVRENSYVDLISINSADGFAIHTRASEGRQVENEKVAALSSTVAAMCASSARELRDEAYRIAIVETDNGHILFINARYHDVPGVLTCVCNGRSTLGEARYVLSKLADAVSRLAA